MTGSGTDPESVSAPLDGLAVDLGVDAIDDFDNGFGRVVNQLYGDGTNDHDTDQQRNRGQVALLGFRFGQVDDRGGVVRQRVLADAVRLRWRQVVEGFDAVAVAGVNDALLVAVRLID